jgi:radical SAM protein with 4Fe4S-binding SPASM domain
MTERRLSPDAYTDFGSWNALTGGSLGTAVVRAHAGDFFPELPEDYLAVTSGPLQNDWPIRADIDITDICNHDCPFCFSQFDRAAHPRRSLDPVLFKSVVDELVKGGTTSIRFCGGGEPLAHPHAYDLVAYVLAQPVHVTLLTNGDLFDRRFQVLFARPFTSIRVSIDAYDERSRIQLHGTHPSSYRRVLSTISSFNELRKERELRETIQIGTTYLLHPANVAGIRGAADALRNAGADYIAFRQIKGVAFAVAFSPELSASVRRELESVKRDFECDTFRVFVTARELTDTGSLPKDHFDTCLVSRVRVIIEADGSVQMCPRARGESSWRTLGRVTTDKGFRDVWQSGVREGQQKCAPTDCKDCIDISSNITLNDLSRFGGGHVSKARFIRVMERS